jgi:hypothetical protein
MNRQTFRLGDGIEIELLPKLQPGKQRRENDRARRRETNEEHDDDEPRVILDVEAMLLGVVGLELTNFTGRLQVKKVEKQKQQQQQQAEPLPSSLEGHELSSSYYSPQNGVVTNDENQENAACVFTAPKATVATASSVSSLLPPPATPTNATRRSGRTLLVREQHMGAAVANPVNLPPLVTLGNSSVLPLNDENPENVQQFITSQEGSCAPAAAAAAVLDQSEYYYGRSTTTTDEDEESFDDEDQHNSILHSNSSQQLIRIPAEWQLMQQEHTSPIMSASSPASLVVSTTPPPSTSSPLHSFQTGVLSSPAHHHHHRGHNGKISIHNVLQQKLAAGGIMLGKMASGCSSQRQRNALNIGNIKRLPPSSSSSSDELFAPPTKLHQACADGLISFSELVQIFLAEPQAIRIKDAHGRLPIHVLGDNDQLLATARGRQVATSFAHKLMYEYPASVGTCNEDGYIPFMNIIQNWLVWIYETHDKVRKNIKARRLQQVGLKQVLSLGGRIGSKSDEDDDIVTPTEQESLSAPLNNNTHSAAATSTSNSVEKSLLMEKSSRAFPLRVDLWDEVEWCFQMLSTIMDEFGGACKILPPPNPRQHLILSKCSSREKTTIDKRQELVKHVIAAFPTLLRTVLLLGNSVTRKRILRLSLFRRMLLCPESVGSWLMRLLRRGGVPSRRAVDYFELVSETKVSDLTGGYRATTAQDLQDFQAAKIQVFVAIEDLQGVVSSLVILETRGRERAAATSAVGHVLNSKLSRPFALSLSCIDLVLHIALLLAFRHVAGESIERGQGDDAEHGSSPTRHVLLITSHYVMRIGCEIYALFTVSPRVLHVYVTDVWKVSLSGSEDGQDFCCTSNSSCLFLIRCWSNSWTISSVPSSIATAMPKLFDLIAIVLTIAATIEQDRNGGQYLSGVNALVVGLLWFKILGKIDAHFCLVVCLGVTLSNLCCFFGPTRISEDYQ